MTKKMSAIIEKLNESHLRLTDEQAGCMTHLRDWLEKSKKKMIKLASITLLILASLGCSTVEIGPVKETHTWLWPVGECRVEVVADPATGAMIVRYEREKVTLESVMLGAVGLLAVAP